MPSVPQTVTTRPGTTASANEVTFIPPGYKQTEVGVVPSDWRVSSVGAEFNIQLGKMLDAAKNVGIPKPYIGNRSVQWGRIDSDDIATVPMTVADLQRFRLRRGDLLVCEGGEIGRAAIWEEPIPECYYQKALHRLRTKGRYDAYLMMSLLQLWTSTGYLANYVTQTSIAHLPKDKLEVVPLPVPPPAEQRAIAEALSDVDKLLGSLEEFIAKKRSIKQAAMQQLLTGKTRLPGFSGAWETRQLDEVIHLISSGIYGLGRQTGLLIGMPVATTAHIDPDDRWNNKKMDIRYFTEHQITHFSPMEGDLIVVKSSGSAASIQSGKIGYVSHDKVGSFVFSNFMMLLRPTRCNAQFLFFQLVSSRVKKMLPYLVEASTYPNLRINDYLELQIPLPSDEEQAAIVDVLSDMDAEITALERRRNKTHTIKQGMMQQFLTGRVRLAYPKAPVEKKKGS